MISKNLKKKQLGRYGEEIATFYLQNKGYNIIERNFKYSLYNEVDIICTKGYCINFVEVRTVSNHNYKPLDSLTNSKIQKVKNASKSYLHTHNKFMSFHKRILLIGLTVDIKLEKVTIEICDVSE